MVAAHAWSESDIAYIRDMPIASLKAIRTHFHVSRVAAMRAQALAGREPLVRNQATPVTPDLYPAIRDAYRDGGVRAVKALLNVRGENAYKAMRLAGVTPGDRPRAPAKPMRKGYMLQAAVAPGMPDAPDMAVAKVLMRKGYAPVCSARIVDPKAPPGEWLVGRKRVSTAELHRMAGA